MDIKKIISFLSCRQDDQLRNRKNSSRNHHFGLKSSYFMEFTIFYDFDKRIQGEPKTHIYEVRRISKYDKQQQLEQLSQSVR